MAHTLDTPIIRIARRQHGLVTVEQLDMLGLTRHAQCRRVATGSLVRVGSRVFSVGGSPRTWEQSALAACLDYRSAVLSHVSAARAWRLEVPADPRIHVTVPFGHNTVRRRPSVVVHRSRCLPDAERARIGPLAVTSLPRTLVDLGAVLPSPALAAVVDDALSRRLVSPDRLWFAAQRHAGLRRAGTRTLLTLVAPWREDGRPESVPEARLRRAIARARLPHPTCQHVIQMPDGTSYRVDFAWPDRMLVLELDGFRWHANPRSHARDSKRRNRLEAAGWRVLHTTPSELDTAPAVVMAALRRHLAGAECV